MGIPAALGIDASGQPPAGDQANAVISGTISAVGPLRAFAFRGPMNLMIWAAIAATLTTTNGSLAATLGSATGLAAGAAISSPNLPPGSTIGALTGTSVTLALPTYTYWGQINAYQPQISGLASTQYLLGATVSGAGIPTGTTVTGIVKAAIAPTPDNPQGQPGIVEISNTPTLTTAPLNPEPFDFSLSSQAVTTGSGVTASFTGSGVSWNGTIQLERSFDGGTTWIACNIGADGTIASWNAGTPISITFGEPEKQVNYRLNCIAYTGTANVTANYRISQTGGAAESLAIGPLSSG